VALILWASAGESFAMLVESTLLTSFALSPCEGGKDEAIRGRLSRGISELFDDDIRYSTNL
jgi:hypothetical protein